MKIFAIGRGQYENIGDIILRRQLLDWVRPAGEMHVYVGNSPAGYDEGLQLQSTDVVYRSLSDWYKVALKSALRGEASYIFKPGEIQLTLIGMKEHLALLPLLTAIRLRGGSAIRAGVGTRNYAPLPRALMRPSIALSTVTLWRDVSTAAYMGTGDVMPDLAFGEGADDETVASFANPSPRRDVLVVSMRSDEPVRPFPGPEWLQAVTSYAAEHDLEIWAVTQVQVDNERTLRLARELGGQALTWDELKDHAHQEQRLRDLYRRTEIALSDRLHVIVAAFTEGAVPVGSLVDHDDKVDRHFRTIGIDGVSLFAAELSTEQFTERLAHLAGQRPQMFQALLTARARLRGHRDTIQRVLGREPSTVAGETVRV